MLDQIRLSSATERVAFSWVVAGLALLVLLGVSITMEDPAPAAGEIPVYAIDEELEPLQTGALEQQDQYADLVEQVAARPEDLRTGVAP